MSNGFVPSHCFINDPTIELANDDQVYLCRSLWGGNAIRGDKMIWWHVINLIFQLVPNRFFLFMDITAFYLNGTNRSWEYVILIFFNVFVECLITIIVNFAFVIVAFIIAGVLRILSLSSINATMIINIIIYNFLALFSSFLSLFSVYCQCYDCSLWWISMQ